MSASNNTNGFTFDSLLPPAIAQKAEDVGVAKANMDGLTMFLLSILAGAFISLGGVFFTRVVSGIEVTGPIRLLGGMTFCIGLILVIIGGAELFTGNNLIVMATISRKVSVSLLLRNWLIVYVGNLAGAIATAYMLYLSKQHESLDMVVGATAVKIAAAKCNPDIGFTAYFFKGIYCNVLVCLAIWMCFSSRTSLDKIACILFPITAFVTCGFEHCVANMYFISIGLFLKNTYINTPLVGDLTNLTWANFFIVDLLPVTLGNIIGGAGFVGLFYWLIYRRDGLISKAE